MKMKTKRLKKTKKRRGEDVCAVSQTLAYQLSQSLTGELVRYAQVSGKCVIAGKGRSRRSAPMSSHFERLRWTPSDQDEDERQRKAVDEERKANKKWNEVKAKGRHKLKPKRCE